MAKTRTIFVCQQCGAQQSRWMGKCPDCGTWDSFVEQVESRTTSAPVRNPATLHNRPVRITEVAIGGFERLPVLGDEFARVLGGGLVPGSLVLIGGDPGIGKTTLLNMVASHFANTVGPALYVSAEESAQQIKLRTERLGLSSDDLFVFAETSLDAVLEQIRELKPRLVIIDSIQTVYLEDVSSAAGSVSQVREGALRLLRIAKELGIPIFLVGHVTKEGAIAGPRVLEHIVDAVLYLEGDRFYQYRLLRGVKNRFGSTNEVGVFEMAGDGMREVANPSAVFLAERQAGTPGSVVAVMMEGTRPLLVEVQALTSNTGNAQPRRTTNGFDLNRFQMLVAVLSKRVGLPLFNQDLYVNIVGGLKVSEPAADLAVTLAVASSYRNARIDPELVCIGEVGLSGELRSVSQLDRRLSEAAKLGFRRAVVPQSTPLPLVEGLEIIPARSLAEVVDRFAGKEGTGNRGQGTA
jgi:DNA repair protein RadA/Sms